MGFGFGVLEADGPGHAADPEEQLCLHLSLAEARCPEVEQHCALVKNRSVARPDEGYGSSMTAAGPPYFRREILRLVTAILRCRAASGCLTLCFGRRHRT